MGLKMGAAAGCGRFGGAGSTLLGAAFPTAPLCASSFLFPGEETSQGTQPVS